MVANWSAKLTPSGWQKIANPNNISLDIRQKVSPSWGATSGSWDGHEMMLKIMQKITLERLLGLFRAPQGGCHVKHLKKMVICPRSDRGGPDLFKITRNVQNGVHFGYFQMWHRKVIKMNPEWLSKWHSKCAPKWTPKWNQNVAKMKPKWHQQL